MRFACLFVIALTAFAAVACDAIDNLTATATPKALTFPDGWEDLPNREKAEASFDHYINTTPGCDKETIERKKWQAGDMYEYSLVVREQLKCVEGYVALGGAEIICEYGRPGEVVRYTSFEPSYSRSYFCGLVPPTPTPIPPTPTPLPPNWSDDDIAPEIPVEAQTYK